jgi:hypothetical protein
VQFTIVTEKHISLGQQTFSPPVVVKRRSRYRGPVAPEDGTGVKFVIATACPVAPRGKPGLKPEDGTGAKRISLGQQTPCREINW